MIKLIIILSVLSITSVYGEPTTHLMSINDFTSGEIIIEWSSDESIRIDSIEYNEGLLDSIELTFLDELPIILLPLELSNNTSYNALDYTITTPNYCTKEITNNCMDKKIYQIPIQIISVNSGIESIVEITINIDTRPKPFSLSLFDMELGVQSLLVIAVLVLVVATIGGIFLRAKQKSRGYSMSKTSHNSGRKHIKS